MTPFVVEHASGAPPFALRIEYGGETMAYSGDTEWSGSLVEAARGADLFVCEAYFFDKRIRYHLDYATLMARRTELDCRRIVLTHMSGDMLAPLSEARLEAADDSVIRL